MKFHCPVLNLRKRGKNVNFKWTFHLLQLSALMFAFIFYIHQFLLFHFLSSFCATMYLFHCLLFTSENAVDECICNCGCFRLFVMIFDLVLHMLWIICNRIAFDLMLRRGISIVVHGVVLVVLWPFGYPQFNLLIKIHIFLLLFPFCLLGAFLRTFKHKIKPFAV